MTMSLDPQHLRETRVTKIMVVQTALMTLATAAVILIAIEKMIRRTTHGLEAILITAAMVWG